LDKKYSLLSLISHHTVKETEMATKKPAKASGPLSSALRFRIEWIFDPGPEFLKINRVAQAQLNQLKSDFTKRANEVISKGQQ
jgi:hypothetical protein